jgi:two-component system sensor histidine kinase KdpD
MLVRASEEASRAQRGRLKVFLGAAPGVGKTYAMLEAARIRQRAGGDVVVGWVETHGRTETEALLDGLEQLAPRVSDYRGLTLREFDLDAALVRRPGLLLVDELAHTNAPGSRHAKRWQDVEELLAAGIDVATTLNIQHLDSLNDVVAIVTGVAITETVPDSVVEHATDLELVDLPPDELLQRLRDGKVYVPETIERALENFFRKGNLIALRELALRRVAERVDAQVAEWRRDTGVARAWPTRERMLVAVGAAPQSAHLVRATFRMAARLRAPWIALSVETPAFDRLKTADRDRIGEHLALAEQLGAETLVVRGERPSDEILAVARERSVSRIVVGKPGRSSWRERLRPSLVTELVHGSGDVEILVTTGTDEPVAVRNRPAVRSPTPWREYAWAAVALVAATLLNVATRSIFVLADQAMVYLLVVLLVATRVGRGPSLFAAIGSVLVLDFFFVPPYYTFSFANLRYTVTFLVMLAAGFIVSHLTHRIRQQAEAARQRERRTAALYGMSRDFAVETAVDEIAHTAVRAVSELLGVDAVLMLDRDGALRPQGASGTWKADSEHETAVARWVLAHGRIAGFSTDTLPGSQGLYLPLVGAGGTHGVLGVALASRPEAPTPAQNQLLETFVAQTALALERALLADAATRAGLVAETERTRSALLAAVSHDLRTPLAAIAGTAEVLLDDSLAPNVRHELLETVREETLRLNRLVTNLLELTRLESGVLQLRKELCPVDEILTTAMARTRTLLQHHDVHVSSPEEDLLVAADPVLLEQAVIHLLDNAAKYSPPGSRIDVAARGAAKTVTIEVADRGPGIVPGEEERIFDRFYRATDGGRTAGAGLGLAICRAIAKAHGGSVHAAQRPGGGAGFSLTLPREAAAPAALLEASPESEGGVRT